MYRSNRPYDRYDSSYRDVQYRGNDYPERYEGQHSRILPSRYDSSGYDYTDRYQSHNRPYNETNRYPAGTRTYAQEEDWRRRRFDRSAIDPYQSGSNKLFGGLSLLASEYDIRKINILLFLLGCSGVSLFVLWKRYISKWIQQMLFRDNESRLDALLPSNSDVMRMDVTNLDQNDPMVKEFKEFTLKRKPKQNVLQPTTKVDLDIEDDEIDELISEVDEKFEKLQKKAEPYVDSTVDGLQYLSQLEHMSQEELEQLYKKEVSLNF
jgi:hypothetical protein